MKGPEKCVKSGVGWNPGLGSDGSVQLSNGTGGTIRAKQRRRALCGGSSHGRNLCSKMSLMLKSWWDSEGACVMFSVSKQNSLGDGLSATETCRVLGSRRPDKHHLTSPCPLETGLVDLQPDAS